MTKKIHGYASGNVETVISVEDVDKQAGALRNKNLTVKDLDKLTNYSPHISIDNLKAGYGEMEILHDIDLRVGDGQSLCLIGPNGAGKSTILHSIFGFTRIFSGDIRIDGEKITNLTPNEKLKDSGIAYILQDNSVFPDMTVEENLMMGNTELSCNIYAIPESFNFSFGVRLVIFSPSIRISPLKILVNPKIL
jgi:branched-chain amino acid transport system ATP-binding protein